MDHEQRGVGAHTLTWDTSADPQGGLSAGRNDVPEGHWIEHPRVRFKLEGQEIHRYGARLLDEGPARRRRLL